MTTYKGERQTPCTFQVKRGLVHKFMVGEGLGTKKIKVNAVNEIQTWEVVKNRQWATWLGIIGLCTGPALVLIGGLLAGVEHKDYTDGDWEYSTALSWNQATPMIVVGGVLTILGIAGMAGGWAKARKKETSNTLD